MKKFIIRDREAGNIIDEFNTLTEAKTALKNYEKEDKKFKVFTENFYEIIEKD